MPSEPPSIPGCHPAPGCTSSHVTVNCLPSTDSKELPLANIGHCRIGAKS